MTNSLITNFSRVSLPLLAMHALPTSAQSISEDYKIYPLDGEVDDRFGNSISAYGALGVIGSPMDNDNGTNSGSAYLFSTLDGQHIVKLLPNDGSTEDGFGNSVAISDSVILVGSPFDDDNGTDSGSAYLFDLTTGLQITKLLPADGAADALFGIDVALSNNIAVIGAAYDDDNGPRSGSAYLFNTSNGQQIAKLLPSDGTAHDWFGNDVAIYGSTVVVSSYRDDDMGIDSGSVYLFNSDTGLQTAKITPIDGEEGDWFGKSIAVSGISLIVGSDKDDDNGQSSGSAYVFNTATGEQIMKILASDGLAFDQFGNSVTIRGTTAIVGTRGADNGFWSGSSYLFDISTGQQVAKYLPSDGSSYDFFGVSATITGSTAFIGASGDNSGSAYAFSLPSLCTPDVTGDGSLDFFDVSAFLTAYAANDPAADFNADGSFNFFDVSAFLVAYLAGCP